MGEDNVTRAFLCTAPSANTTAIPHSQVWINNLSRGLTSLGVEIFLPTFDTHRHMQECMGTVDGVEPTAARALYTELLLQDVRQEAGDGSVLNVFEEAIRTETPTRADLAAAFAEACGTL